MGFGSSSFDLESIDNMTLNSLIKDISDIDLTSGYSRADLESIENRLPGAFTDLEEFDFRELPSGVSRVNLNIVEKRLFELRKEIGGGITNRYHSYVNIYGNLIHELTSILSIVDKFKEDTPSPLIEDLDSVYLHDTDFDSIKLTDVVFSKYNGLYTKVRLLRDNSKNDRINAFNFIIEDMINMDDLIDSKKEYKYSILKNILNTNEITYNNTISLFSNSNSLNEFIKNTTDELLKTLAELKDIITWDYNDDATTKWAASSARLDKYVSLANDRHSRKLITLLSTFRYFDKYKN